ncbi:adenylate/guanylate cyclase domain-containing protein, partial [Gemmatimonadota bacterium]
ACTSSSSNQSCLRMQEAIEELNAERKERRETALELRVGINTGVAVAGNMGSATRLNYTVLGEHVNLAARLCQAAECAEILFSEGTRAEIKGEVEVISKGWRELKGFSKSIPVFSPVGPVSPARDPAPGDPGSTGTLLGIIIALVAMLPGPLAGQTQEGGLPTLRELGVGYLSESGAVQLDLSGRMDLEVFFPQGDPPYLIPTGSAFWAPRIQLFGDLFLGDRLYLFGEVQMDRGEEPADGSVEGRLDQAFLRFQPFRELDLAFQVGKFAPPLGSLAARHNLGSEPFVRPALPYEHRTMICPFLAPSSAERFVAWKDDPDRFRPQGAPPIWGVPYLWGGMVLAGQGPFSVQAALLNGAVSSEPKYWTLKEGRFDAPTYVASVGVRVTPELRLTGWYHRGPYLVDDMAGSLPSYAAVEDYVQEIMGGEAVFSRGRGTLRGEVFWDRWEVPNVGDDPIDISYVMEGSYRLIPGLTGALRVSGVSFNGLRATEDLGTGQGGYGYGGSSSREAWDYDITRYQGALAYRIRVNTGVKAEVALNRSQGPLDPQDDLFSIQWWWAF